ncbi:hypothetical protein A2U01_0029810 [Trifolium medium]|uniref:Uncharacterized protein n=1 Tax=Trifolium medium TaxID=97028 RepID=A0A392P9C6_9FABA|nr:hypothetical protein [Trifolium medium]
MLCLKFSFVSAFPPSSGTAFPSIVQDGLIVHSALRFLFLVLSGLTSTVFSKVSTLPSILVVPFEAMHNTRIAKKSEPVDRIGTIL